MPIKRRVGKAAYVIAGLIQLAHQKSTLYDVEIDGTTYRAASAIVAKGHFYAGRYICAPAARLDRPVFEICLFKNPGRWNVLRYAVALALNRLDRLSDVTVVSGHRVRITGPTGEPVQSDGDIIALAAGGAGDRGEGIAAGDAAALTLSRRGEGASEASG